MTDKQRKEAMEWVEKEIEDREACVKSLVGEFDYYPTKDEEEQCAFLEESLGYLKTILSALEPKTVTREWLSRWERIFKTPTTYPGALLIEMIKELGHAIKEDD